MGAEAAERWGRRRVRRQVRGRQNGTWLGNCDTHQGGIRAKGSTRVGDRGKGGLGVNAGDVMNS